MDGDSSRRPINLPGDNFTIFPGIIGSHYTPGHGILLLAINPGGGGDAHTKRILEDDVFYPLLQSFKASDDIDVVQAFEAMNNVFVPIV